MIELRVRFRLLQGVPQKKRKKGQLNAGDSPIHGGDLVRQGEKGKKDGLGKNFGIRS